MSINATSSSGDTRIISVKVEPHDGTTVGGTLLLIADPPTVEEKATFAVEWFIERPIQLYGRDSQISQLGTAIVSDTQIELPSTRALNGEKMPRLRATLDTSRLTVGSVHVRVRLTELLDDVSGVDELSQRPLILEGDSGPIEIRPRPFAAGDDVAVTLRRSAVPATSDQALWVAIRNSTNALGFNSYSRFIDSVMCGDLPDEVETGRYGFKDTRHTLRKIKRRTALPFPNVDRYRLLKAATEVFLMINCGVDLDDFRGVNLEDESRRLNRTVRPGELEAQMRSYLTQVVTGDGQSIDVLPYLGLIRLQLRDVAIVGGDSDDDEAAQICHGILAEKLTNPCFIELLWSYWHDEGGLMQTLNAITWRFQNRTAGRPGRDPLTNLEIDPLRPLSNLLWGWIQDAEHRLALARRAYEYDHEYGLVLVAKPGPPVRGADSRSRFIEAFHHLLAVCAEFYIRDDDTTVIADGFGVLNALKETHIILTQGAHNQYGDLPWTARHEMLMNQWILGLPEMRDFLPTRVMVVEPEAWMSRVESMNKLQGWSDVAVLHFRDLAVFGEQLLLGIRFGSWTTVIEPEQAANWARYWRSEIQRYTHAYRAVTGVDLTRGADSAVPAFHLRRQRLSYRG
jgi:hypothetical protein